MSQAATLATKPQDKTTALHPTHQTIPHHIRGQIVELLQTRVSEGIDLTYQVKQAHWNVRGPRFFSLHKLFDKTYEHLQDNVDTIAERLVQLGGIAQGTIRSAVKISKLPDYPVGYITEDEHIELVSRGLANFSQTLRDDIERFAEWEDPGSADVLTEVIRAVDKDLWMVEAHRKSGNAQAKAG